VVSDTKEENRTNPMKLLDIFFHNTNALVFAGLMAVIRQPSAQPHPVESDSGTGERSPKVVAYVSAWGSECSSSMFPTGALVGSVGSLRINVYGTAPGAGVLPGLGTVAVPSLDVEAGYVPSDPETEKLSGEQLVPLRNFTASQALTRSLNLRPFRTKRQLRAESIWRAGGEVSTYLDALHSAQFSFTVPEQLVAQRIWFRVSYTTTDGSLVQSAMSSVVVAESPCSHGDSVRILASKICTFAEGQNLEEAVAWGDTIMHRGWADLTALVYVRTAAAEAKHYDKAIQFLDYMYAATGRVDDYGPEGAVDTAVVRSTYETMRQRFLAKQAEQQR